MFLQFLQYLTRSSCYVAGELYPVYATYRALKEKSPEQQQKWLAFWVVYSPLMIAEYLPVSLSEWLPFFYEFKLLLLCWLLLKRFNGAVTVYRSFVAPFIAKHETEIDAGLTRWRGAVSAKASEWRRDGVQAVRRHSVQLLLKSQAAILQSMTSAPPTAATAAAQAAQPALITAPPTAATAAMPTAAQQLISSVVLPSVMSAITSAVVSVQQQQLQSSQQTATVSVIEESAPPVAAAAATAAPIAVSVPAPIAAAVTTPRLSVSAPAAAARPALGDRTSAEGNAPVAAVAAPSSAASLVKFTISGTAIEQEKMREPTRRASLVRLGEVD